MKHSRENDDEETPTRKRRKLESGDVRRFENKDIEEEEALSDDFHARYFFRVLFEAGIDKDQYKKEKLISMETNKDTPSSVLKILEKELKNKSVARDNFCASFIQLSKDPVFLGCMLKKTSSCKGNFHNQSLINIFLRINSIQPDIIQSLLRNIQMGTFPKNRKFIENLPKQVLHSLKWLDMIVDPEGLFKSIDECLTTLDIDLRRELISLLPEIFLDFDDVAILDQLTTRLLELMRAESRLNLSIIETFSHLSIPKESTSKVLSILGDNLAGLEHDHIPVALWFLIGSSTDSDLVEVVNKIRNEIDLEFGIDEEENDEDSDEEEKGEKSKSAEESICLILDMLYQIFKCSKKVKNTFISLAQKKINAPFDYFVFIVAINNDAYERGAIKVFEKLVKDSIITPTETKFLGFLEKFKKPLMNYLPVLVKIARTYLQRNDPKLQNFAIELYKFLFMKIAPVDNSEVVSRDRRDLVVSRLISHVGAVEKKFQRTLALGILLYLAKKDSENLVMYKNLVKDLLDTLEQFESVEEIRQIYKVFSHFMIHSAGQSGSRVNVSGGNSTEHQEIHIILEKQLHSPFISTVRVGTVGMIQILETFLSHGVKYLSNVLIEEEIEGEGEFDESDEESNNNLSKSKPRNVLLEKEALEKNFHYFIIHYGEKCKKPIPSCVYYEELSNYIYNNSSYMVIIPKEITKQVLRELTEVNFRKTMFITDHEQSKKVVRRKKSSQKSTFPIEIDIQKDLEGTETSIWMKPSPSGILKNGNLEVSEILKKNDVVEILSFIVKERYVEIWKYILSLRLLKNLEIKGFLEPGKSRNRLVKKIREAILLSSSLPYQGIKKGKYSLFNDSSKIEILKILYSGIRMFDMESFNYNKNMNLKSIVSDRFGKCIFLAVNWLREILNMIIRSLVKYWKINYYYRIKLLHGKLGKRKDSRKMEDEEDKNRSKEQYSYSSDFEIGELLYLFETRLGDLSDCEIRFDKMLAYWPKFAINQTNLFLSITSGEKTLLSSSGVQNKGKLATLMVQQYRDRNEMYKKKKISQMEKEESEEEKKDSNNSDSEILSAGNNDNDDTAEIGKNKKRKKKKKKKKKEGKKKVDEEKNDKEVGKKNISKKATQKQGWKFTVDKVNTKKHKNFFRELSSDLVLIFRIFYYPKEFSQSAPNLFKRSVYSKFFLKPKSIHFILRDIHTKLVLIKKKKDGQLTGGGLAKSKISAVSCEGLNNSRFFRNCFPKDYTFRLLKELVPFLPFILSHLSEFKKHKRMVDEEESDEENEKSDNDNDDKFKVSSKQQETIFSNESIILIFDILTELLNYFSCPVLFRSYFQFDKKFSKYYEERRDRLEKKKEDEDSLDIMDDESNTNDELSDDEDGYYSIYKDDSDLSKKDMRFLVQCFVKFMSITRDIDDFMFVSKVLNFLRSLHTRLSDTCKSILSTSPSKVHLDEGKTDLGRKLWNFAYEHLSSENFIEGSIRSAELGQMIRCYVHSGDYALIGIQRLMLSVNKFLRPYQPTISGDKNDILYIENVVKNVMKYHNPKKDDLLEDSMTEEEEKDVKEKHSSKLGTTIKKTVKLYLGFILNELLFCLKQIPKNINLIRKRITEEKKNKKKNTNNGKKKKLWNDENNNELEEIDEIDEEQGEIEVDEDFILEKQVKDDLRLLKNGLELLVYMLSFDSFSDTYKGIREKMLRGNHRMLNDIFIPFLDYCSLFLSLRKNNYFFHRNRRNVSNPNSKKKLKLYQKNKESIVRILNIVRNSYFKKIESVLQNASVEKTGKAKDMVPKIRALMGGYGIHEKNILDEHQMAEEEDEEAGKFMEDEESGDEHLYEDILSASSQSQKMVDEDEDEDDKEDEDETKKSKKKKKRKKKSKKKEEDITEHDKDGRDKKRKKKRKKKKKRKNEEEKEEIVEVRKDDEIDDNSEKKEERKPRKKKKKKKDIIEEEVEKPKKQKKKKKKKDIIEEKDDENEKNEISNENQEKKKKKKKSVKKRRKRKEVEEEERNSNSDDDDQKKEKKKKRKKKKKKKKSSKKK